jgi:hypothetical protein
MVMKKINVRLASHAFSNLRNDPLAKINANLHQLGLRKQQPGLPPRHY